MSVKRRLRPIKSHGMRMAALLSLAVVVLPTSLSAQAHIWSRKYGGVGTQSSWGVALDSQDNVVITGVFLSSADFGGAPLVGAGDYDIFVAKLDAFGNHIWSKGLGSSGYDWAWSVAVDQTDRIMVTGAHSGTINFGGSPLTSTAGKNVFLACFDADGNHIWSKSFGGANGGEGYSVSVDAAGRPAITGIFTGTVNFGGVPLTSAGNQDIFMAKYDADGNHMWSRRAGRGSSDWGYRCASTPNGDVVVTGFATTFPDLGGGALPGYGGGDVFLVRYNLAGGHVWSRVFGGAGSDHCQAMGMDVDGNIAIAGQFQGTVDYGGDPLVSAGGWDVFLAKYDSLGTHLWSRRYGSSIGSDGGRGLYLSREALVLTGMFGGSVSFGGAPLYTGSYQDIFLAEYDGDGNHRWSIQLGDSIINNDESNAVAIDTYGNVVVTGKYLGDVDFGGGVISSDGHDAFLAKYVAIATSVPAASALPLVVSQFPNPFNPSTTIAFELPHASRAVVEIFTLDGQHVVTLLDKDVPAGHVELTWDGRTRGGPAASGVYFCRVWASGLTETLKLVLLK